ncbi:alcohol dehydrogenase-like protein [Leptodontidium sp. 2 PMI_412]|nr:alcohol dehydrogenase II [Leptodontidium sp. MPI-SDFR-AT-0119]KAH9222328.1 alcohol dehydrogenase-like protein [Leptodontidium sp. 2 PMI_412]
MSGNIAATYAEPGSSKIAIETLDIPKPAAGEVLVKITHSGVCHSDLAVCTQAWPILPFPTQKGQVGGHEGVGEVVELGPGVQEPKLGSRVGIKWLSSVCGSCDACLEGDDNTCASQKISGYYTPGTFQQFVCTSASYATPIPLGVSSAEAAPILCAGLTVYSGLRKTNTKPGDWIVISGAGGGLGHLAVQYASRVLGLRVIGIDHGSKRALVMECGAEEFMDFTQFNDTELEEAVKKFTKGGRGANAVVVVSAANKSYEQALRFLKPLGTLVCIGMPEGTAVPIQSAFPARITNQQFRIVGSAIGNRREAIEALEFAARGLVKCHIKIEKLENLSKIFEDMHAGNLQARVVVALP